LEPQIVNRVFVMHSLGSGTYLHGRSFGLLRRVVGLTSV